MKRTVYLFAISLIAVILFISFTDTANSSGSGGCCQKFALITTGSPLSGCIVRIVTPGTPMECTPDDNLECQICGLTSGNNYTVEVTCNGNRTGQANFTACGSTVYITVP